MDAYVRDFARWTPRAPALRLADRRVSYAELDADVERQAAALAAQGLAPGGGAVAVSTDDPYLRQVTELALSRLEIAAALHGAAGVPLQAPSLAGPPSRAPPARLPDPDGLAAVLPGAQGAPVGVTWRRLERMVFTALRTCCAGRQGTWIAADQLPPMAALGLAAAGWSGGAAIAPDFAAGEIRERLETLPPGVIWTTPAGLADLVQALPAGIRVLPEWRVVCCGPGLDPAVARQARLDLTPDIHLLYGPEEAAFTAIGTAADLEGAAGFAGWVPSDTEAMILDARGDAVAPGEAGELRIAGPRVASGYLDDAAASAVRFLGGAFRTGQLASKLPDGRLVLHGAA